MNVETGNLILTELRGLKTELHDFRTENEKRWEENNKRWEHNEERWRENDRKWERNEERWRENDKKWEHNEERWSENSQKWEQNDKKLEEINERLEQTNKRIENTNERVSALEEGRGKDRRDILLVIETMQKSINDQFVEMKEYLDTKFEKIVALQKVNDIEHDEFKKLLFSHDKRLDFHSARISYLEEWKEQLDLGEYTAV
ncbi:MAG: hypothetical protein HFJ33_06580 [Clostridia bacterium]|nr:hypothetical protein [Clostridia bacterium]